MPEPAPKTVAVTGATGFVGRWTVRALVERGHQVRALVRDPAKARGVLPADGVQTVVGDVLDARACATLVRGCHAVVHAIGIRRELPPEITFEKLHPRATACVVDAARDAGVERFVHVSALGTRPDAPSAYHQSKWEAEALVRSSALAWTILRPSLIHGPDGEFVQMVKAWVLGRAQPFFFIPYFTRAEFSGGGPPRLVSARVQPIAVEDVAEAIVESLASPSAVGEIYPLGGPDAMDWPTLMGAIRDAVPLGEKSKKIIGLPGPVGAAAARLAGALGLGALLPFGPSEPVMASEDSVCSNAKASAELGVRPRALLPTLRAYAARI